MVMKAAAGRPFWSAAAIATGGMVASAPIIFSSGNSVSHGISSLPSGFDHDGATGARGFIDPRLCWTGH